MSIAIVADEIGFAQWENAMRQFFVQHLGEVVWVLTDNGHGPGGGVGTVSTVTGTKVSLVTAAGSRWTRFADIADYGIVSMEEVG